MNYGADISAKNVHGQTPYGLVRKPTSDWDFLTGKKRIDTEQVNPSEEIKISLRRSRPSSDIQPSDDHSPKLKIKLRGTSPEVQNENVQLDGIVPCYWLTY